MKKWLLLSLVIVGVMGFMGCDDDDDDGPDIPNGPGAYQANYRTSSEFFTQMAGMVPGSSPHGTVQIWYSKNIQEIINDPTFVVPEGTVSIKEFDNDNNGTMDGIVVMIKKEKGYDSANNDWYYEMRDAAGTIVDPPTPGKIATCIGCHAACSAKDFLCGTNLR